jgi:hypothetical protein
VGTGAVVGFGAGFALPPKATAAMIATPATAPSDAARIEVRRGPAELVAFMGSGAFLSEHGALGW